MDAATRLRNKWGFEVLVHPIPPVCERGTPAIMSDPSLSRQRDAVNLAHVDCREEQADAVQVQ